MGAPEQGREMLVCCRYAGAPIDYKEGDIGLGQGSLGLNHHARAETISGRFLQPGGVGHAEPQRTDAPLALAPEKKKNG